MTNEIIDEMFEVLSNNIKKIYSNLKMSDKDYLTWKNNIMSNENLMTIIIKDDLLNGYLQYMNLNNEICICEVQIREANQHDNLTLKCLLSQLTKECKTIDETIIYGNINPKNKHSVDVFTHIGFLNEKKNRYEITGEKLMKYLNC